MFESMKNFPASQWIAWIIATITASITLTVGNFTTFETQSHAKESRQQLEKKVEESQRVTERQIDQVLENQKALQKKLDRLIMTVSKVHR